jgi:hypothetical protein
LTLILTPILDPATWSARNQANRLLSGRANVETFDFAALKFDMGKPGARALARIAAVKDHPQAAVIALRLAEVAKAKSKWDVVSTPTPSQAAERRAALKQRLVVIPKGAPVPDELADWLIANDSDLLESKEPKGAALYLVQQPGLDPVIIDTGNRQSIRAFRKNVSGKWQAIWIDTASVDWQQLKAGLAAGAVSSQAITSQRLRIGNQLMPQPHGETEEKWMQLNSGNSARP